ncbi:hypothetical protein BJ165DRAFT_1400584 [Panaeolus papilionaceus]|nr:hypothetical protein BJ165DRAFT_1400584 [Panaeolus papilionaceus]
MDSTSDPELHEPFVLQEQREERQADRGYKGTEKYYQRHVNNFVNWFEKDQQHQKEEWDRDQEEKADAEAKARAEAGLPMIPRKLEPFQYTPTQPITPTKASYSWWKRSARRYNCWNKLKQMINSLENYCLEHSHNPEYLTEPESQKKLRDDIRICNIEQSSQLGEAKCQEESQEMKVEGIVSDLNVEEIPMPGISLDHHIKALVLMSNQGKTNRTG